MRTVRGGPDMNLKPVIVRGEEMFKQSDITIEVASHINAGMFFTRRAKAMTQDLKQAEEMVDKWVASLTKALDTFHKKEDHLAEVSKKASGRVRNAAQQLSDGLAKIEGRANFDRLERYVDLLERAEAAMTALAKLDADGRLEKIAAAIR